MRKDKIMDVRGSSSNRFKPPCKIKLTKNGKTLTRCPQIGIEEVWERDEIDQPYHPAEGPQGRDSLRLQTHRFSMSTDKEREILVGRVYETTSGGPFRPDTGTFVADDDDRSDSPAA